MGDGAYMAAQGKRKGGVSNFMFYTPLPEPTPVLAAEETTDSTATDSTALATAAQETDSEQTSSSTSNPEESEASSPKKTRVTDDTPEPGTVKGYITIVGGFVTQPCEKFLNDISNDWAQMPSCRATTTNTT